jgi:ankyrin repeat protein
MNALLRAVVVVACATVAVVALSSPSTLAQQAQPRVDFVSEVQPLLRQRCVSCHGPSQQMSGLRLDRRRDAMRGSTFGAVIGPGNGEASRLYLRISGNTRGQQMPPTGAMAPEQISLLKRWIDEGAEWPDAASGDVAAVPADPGAAKLMTMLRTGDIKAFQRALSMSPEAAKRNGDAGVTPLHYASLYADAPAVKALLDVGADPNARNDAGATALMWATDDLAKTRLLVERGADVNAKSLDGRTPIMLAAARAGSSPVLSFLLDKGANPNADLADVTALGEAAYAADVAAMRLLIARGADPKIGIESSIAGAAGADCAACIELLLPSLSKEQLNRVAFLVLPPIDDGDELQMLLDHGLDLESKDRRGHSLRAMAAASDTLPAAVLQRLPEILTNPARVASLHASAALPAPAASAKAAVARALPILQQTGVTFRQKSGCVSCHNNTLTARVTAEARRSRIPFDEAIAETEVTGIAKFLESWRERALQGLGIPGDADTVSYILLGLSDEHYPADAATDAMARFLKNRQLADGSWRTVAHRPPIESSDITVTAISARAIQAYAPGPFRAQYENAARAAGNWLAAQTPRSTEARAFQLQGMNWAGEPANQLRKLASALASEQRADGGWSQLPTLSSDAYATGQALVVLHDAGGMKITDPVYQRGIAYLLKTQYADGTWAVTSRALPIQPLFSIGFPHGDDSWISAAGTNWAATALALAAR